MFGLFVNSFEQDYNSNTFTGNFGISRYLNPFIIAFIFHTYAPPFSFLLDVGKKFGDFKYVLYQLFPMLVQK